MAGLGLKGMAHVTTSRAAARGLSEPEAIAIRAVPIRAFSPRDPSRRNFGRLTFRGGLDLRADHADFGGFSGLWRSPQGGRDLVAVSDAGHWLVATVETGVDGTPAGLARARLAPIRDARGRALGETRLYDTEGLAIADGVAYVSIERVATVLRFDFVRDGVAARGRPVPLPEATRRLPRNQGLEGIAVAPRASAIAGALVVAAERSDGRTETTQGWILGGPSPGGFRILRRGDFDVTDLAFLPDGDLIILDRRFSYLTGLAIRLRRIAATALVPGATLDGPSLLEADLGEDIDNMEGLSVHRETGGATILTLISDDNFSRLQRTILLEFALTS